MTFILPGGLGQLFAKSAFSAWDPAHTNTRATLSNNNLTVAGNNATVGQTRGTKSPNSGKLYFEITINALGASTSEANIGFCNATWDTSTANTNDLGQDAAGNAWGFSPIPTTGYYCVHAGAITGNTGLQTTVPAVNDTISVALDFTAGKAWCAVNNVWNNGTGVTGTADFTFTAATSLYAASSVDLQTTAAQFTLNVGKTAFKYALPSGYTAWG